MRVESMDTCWTRSDLGRTSLWTLKRPAAGNALCRQARAALEEMVSAIADERDVRSVIITGAGEKAFCSGADLKERAEMTEEEVREWLVDLGRTLSALESSPKIFIAAINGAALGGGLELALACDIRVASRNATFGLPEVRLGIIPGGGGTQRLPRLIGAGRAKELILTGRRLEATEAHRIGLVERIAPGGSPPTEAQEKAFELAEEIGKGAPLALAGAKRAMLAGQDAPIDTGLDVERRCYESVLRTRDRLEGIAAFRERRSPVYRGE